MAELIKIGDKTLFQVIAIEERRHTFFVLADSRDQARSDAEELAASLDTNDWDDVECDIECREARAFPVQDRRIWSGGPEGDWISAHGEEATKSRA